LVLKNPVNAGLRVAGVESERAARGHRFHGACGAYNTRLQ